MAKLPKSWRLRKFFCWQFSLPAELIRLGQVQAIRIYSYMSLSYILPSKVLIPITSLENQMHTLWILFALRLFSAGSFLLETPQLWADIANDKHIGDGTRRIAVILLADRHARPGMTLTAFCSLFDNPNWLSKEDFTNWNKAVLAAWRYLCRLFSHKWTDGC